MNKLHIALASATLLAATTAHAGLIDFEVNGGLNNSVGNFYQGSDGVTFVNATWNTTFGLPGSSGQAAIRSTSSVFQPQPSFPISAIFNTPVTSVGITGIDTGANGVQLLAYNSANVLIASDFYTGVGLGIGDFHVLVTSASGIARVEFSQSQNVVGDGVIWDDFTYGQSVAAPDSASTLALMAMGVAGLAAFRRSKA